MEIKILQVFYGKDGLPYKDKDRQVHFPITGTGFLGASNTTKIKFYYDELDNLDETTWVAVSKLPNGKVGSRVLESYLDEELNEHYALLELDNYYTQYKGDVFISLQGYQGGVDFDYDEDNSQYEIHGTPTIAATGSIKFTINYANQFVGSGETDNINFQRILAALGTKLGMRAYSEHVEELPSEGSPDVFYVVNDEPNNPNLANIYVWNENTRHYIWVGDNTLDLGEYYTKEQGEQFEENINEDIENTTSRINHIQDQVNSLSSGAPAGTYATYSDLTSANPDHSKIYLVLEDGKWYYYDTSTSSWTGGGQYLSTGGAANEKQFSFVKNSFGGLDYFVDSGEQNGYYDTDGVFHSHFSYTCSKFPSYNIFEINFTNIANVLAEVILLDKNDSVISSHGTSIGSYSIKIPDNCYYIAINFFGSTYTDGFTIRSFKSANKEYVNNYLNNLSNGKLRIKIIDDPSIYAKAEALNGSVTSHTENSVTFSYSSASAFNGIIFSADTSQLPIDDNLDRTFRFEFDATIGTGDDVNFRVQDNNNAVLYENKITNGHNVILVDLKDTTESIKYVYFANYYTDNVSRTLVISNIVIYQGTKEINADLYELLYQSSKNLPGKIKIFAYNDATVYSLSQGVNATKVATNTSVAFTYSVPLNFNGVIFGTTATPVTISNDFTKRLVLEFDADFVEENSAIRCRLVDNDNGGVTINVIKGHNKIIFDEQYLNNGIKYIFFADYTNTEISKTLTVSNIELYQGDDVDPYLYEQIYEIEKRLPADANPLYNKKILTIGDSLTNSAGDGLHWQTFVVQEFGMVGYATAGGAGYTIANRTENSIYSHVMALTVDNDVEVITLWGGTNDWGEGVPLGDFDTQKVASTRDNTTFYGGLFDCVEKLLTLYPTKSLMLVGTTQRIIDYANGYDSNNSTTSGKKLEDFVEAVKKVADYYSLPFMDLYHKSNINKYSMPTYMFPQTRNDVTYYLHFSGTGQRHIAKKFIEFIKRYFL